MDNFETASNTSEGGISNLSSLSGLTGYEEELYDLKHFIKLSPHSQSHIKSSDNNNHRSFEVFEERIKTLNEELQNSLKLNEKYKNDMSNMERKTELAFHEKFEKLMRLNAQLEAQLTVANERIHNSLIKNCGQHNNNQIEQKLTRFEKQEFELQAKIDLLENEIKHWKKEAETYEVLHSQFKLEIEELKIEVGTKSNSIDALKSKIVELHMEMQNLNQDNVKVHNIIAITSNELDSFKKSEKWYKEQLHQCRAQKSEVLEEISKLQSLLITKDRELDLKNSALINLKNNFDELHLTSLQEKEKLLKRIAQIQKLEASKINLEPQGQINFIDQNYESTIIESLSRELILIKEAINEQQGSFEGINKKNSELIAQNTTLKKTLNDKEIFISNLECEKTDLNVRLEILFKQLRENEKLLMKTVNEKAEIEVSLKGADREKREIEDAVKIIRENFTKFAASYNNIKEELNEKNKQILQLQQENLKATELEEINRKLNQHILDLEHELINFNFCSNQLTKTKINNQNLQSINCKLRNELENLGIILKTTNDNKEKLEQEFIEQQKLEKYFEEKLEELNQNVQLKDKLIVDLNQDLNNSTKSVEALEKINQDLLEKLNSSNDFQHKLEEAHNLNNLLQKENLELKEKVTKFVTNNFNGFSNRINKNEEIQIELWFSGVLDWIFSALLEIQANNKVNQTKFIFNNCLLNLKNLETKCEKIFNLLVSISSTKFIEYEQLHQMRLINKKLKQHVNKINKNVFERLTCLEDKCHHLDKCQEEDLEALQKITKLSSENDVEEQLSPVLDTLKEEIKRLKILFKAKELENNEKQKRYEVNNSTLLKKVKEHMRGRNSAEKRCSYLQELYNNVFDELNSYKLQENSKECEIRNLQSVCENYKNINAKMKQELVRLEKELGLVEATKALDCVKCLEYESLKKIVADLETKLKEKEILINNLQVQIQETVHINTTLQRENNNFVEKVEKLNEELHEQKRQMEKLQITLQKERKTMEEVQELLLDQQKQHSSCVMELENAQQISQHTQEKNKLLSEEIELFNSKLNNIKNECNTLKAKNNSLTEDWSRKEALMQTFVMNLQSEIQLLQTELVSMRSDKHFLQRLCSDLKLALETSLNQSKVLKKHVQTLSSESKESISLPDSIINLPSPSKYDDAYINQLLKQSSAPKIEKPLGDLQNCLNSLKKEMICLRNQVTHRGGSGV